LFILDARTTAYVGAKKSGGVWWWGDGTPANPVITANWSPVDPGNKVIDLYIVMASKYAGLPIKFGDVDSARVDYAVCEIDV
jgi:hypothetical protein